MLHQLRECSGPGTSVCQGFRAASDTPNQDYIIKEAGRPLHSRQPALSGRPVGQFIEDHITKAVRQRGMK